MTANTILRLSQDTLAPCSVVPAESLLTAAPTERGDVFHDAGNGVVCGVWEATPYAERFEAYPVNEFAQVLSGRVVITPDGGAAQSFGAGESYFMAKGFTGRFEVTETLRKFYMTAE